MFPSILTTAAMAALFYSSTATNTGFVPSYYQHQRNIHTKQIMPHLRQTSPKTKSPLPASSNLAPLLLHNNHLSKFTQQYHQQKRFHTALQQENSANSETALPSFTNLVHSSTSLDQDTLLSKTTDAQQPQETPLSDGQAYNHILDNYYNETLRHPQTVVGAITQPDMNSENTFLTTPTTTTSSSQNQPNNAIRTTTDDINLIPTADTESSQTTSSKTPMATAPSLWKILTFAIPAIGIWLCGPLLGVIDTSAVGLLSGTAQQAALSPAVAMTDFAAILVAFMYTATTNLVASVSSPQKKKNALIASLQLSTWVGLGLGATLFLSARPVLTTLIGNNSLEPEVFAAAIRYVRIRALGAPAAVIIGSAQSASLGLQDIRSPFYILVAAALVNLLGDAIFVAQSHPLLGGAAGAAWATIISQWAAVALFLKWLRTPPSSSSRYPNQQTNTHTHPVNLTDGIIELMAAESSSSTTAASTTEPAHTQTHPNTTQNTTRRKSARIRKFNTALTTYFDKQKSTTNNHKQKPHLSPSHHKKLRSPLSLWRRLRQSRPSDGTSSAPSSSPSFTTRGFLANDDADDTHNLSSSLDLLVKLPPRSMIRQFLPYVVPVTTSSFGRLAAYVAMNHVVSSTLGTTAMAAQQIVLSVFSCLTPVADSLSQTAQSFIPSVLMATKSYKPSKSVPLLHKTTFNFWKVGAIFGAAMSGAVACIPFLSALFTKDPFVIAQANSAVPFLATVFAIHGLVCGTEGILLARRDLGFLGRAYGVFFFGAPFFMLRVKSAAKMGRPGINLTSVWSVFLSYQLVRFTVFIGRLLWVQRRDRRQVQQQLQQETSN